ncbi:unnamed protein product, partial [Ixodes pacificus]
IAETRGIRSGAPSALSRGHFLYYGLRSVEPKDKDSQRGNVSSPWFGQAALQRCTLVFSMHATAMLDGALVVLLTNPNHTWEVRKVHANSMNQ